VDRVSEPRSVQKIADMPSALRSAAERSGNGLLGSGFNGLEPLLPLDKIYRRFA
jgi:hypothetical protein